MSFARRPIGSTIVGEQLGLPIPKVNPWDPYPCDLCGYSGAGIPLLVQGVDVCDESHRIEILICRGCWRDICDRRGIGPDIDPGGHA